MDDLWFYLSFADADHFLGGAYVRGGSLVEAVTRSHVLGINPGGEVMSIGPIPEPALAEHVEVEDRERLLSKSELGPVFGVEG